jgi:hypothetical protein
MPTPGGGGPVHLKILLSLVSAYTTPRSVDIASPVILAPVGSPALRALQFAPPSTLLKIPPPMVPA